MFGPTLQNRREVEGALFVARCSDLPRFKLMILNRLSPESYVLPVTASMQISINQQYLMARYKDVCISAAVVVVVVGCLLACCAYTFAEAYPLDTRHLVQGCS